MTQIKLKIITFANQMYDFVRINQRKRRQSNGNVYIGLRKIKHLE